jgi:hypothetical protein
MECGFLTFQADVCIVDAVEGGIYERYLYRCLAPMPFRKYERRRRYLESAVPAGLRKKILFYGDSAVGQIEYAPAEASGYPIFGGDVVVLNCIWVLRRAKGHRFGRLLMDEMMRDHSDADCFATVGLEDHWSGWLRKEHMEYLGFRSIDSIAVSHKVKHPDMRFKIHLMWIPNRSDKPPSWRRSELLRGVDFCMAHPLYRPKSIRTEEILRRVP